MNPEITIVIEAVRSCQGYCSTCSAVVGWQSWVDNPYRGKIERTGLAFSLQIVIMLPQWAMR